MQIYIASHSQELALDVAQQIETKTCHRIAARWIYTDFLRTAEHTEDERRRIAIMDVEDVTECDAIIHLAGPERYAGGKFIETGIGLGQGKRVILIGRRENMLMWHPCVHQAENIDDAIAGGLL